jgi:hypothetical protein
VQQIVDRESWHYHLQDQLSPIGDARDDKITKINCDIDTILRTVQNAQNAGYLMYVSPQHCFGSFQGPATHEREIAINYFDGTATSAWIIQVQILKLTQLLIQYYEDDVTNPIKASYLAVVDLLRQYFNGDQGS